MRTLLILCAAALMAVTASLTQAAKPSASDSCCAPGAACCYPGSPCCEGLTSSCCESDKKADCCNPPSECCAAGASCCEAAKKPSGDCCNPPSACCEAGGSCCQK